MKRSLLLLPVLLAFALCAHAVSEDDLLPADQAFRFHAALADSQMVRAEWDIAHGYYLYRDKIHFSTSAPGIELGAPRFPEAHIKDDEFFGKMPIYRDTLVVEIPFTRATGAPQSFELDAKSQGCADVGVCYPPQTQKASLAFTAQNAKAATPPAAAATAALSSFGEDYAAAEGESEFLDPDEAFRFSAEPDGGDALLAHWDVADGYYLYRDKFKFRLEDASGVTLKDAELPPGEVKERRVLRTHRGLSPRCRRTPAAAAHFRRRPSP